MPVNWFHQNSFVCQEIRYLYKSDFYVQVFLFLVVQLISAIITIILHVFVCVDFLAKKRKILLK